MHFLFTGTFIKDELIENFFIDIVLTGLHRCEKCEFVAETQKDLKVHMKSTHKHKHLKKI